MIIPYIFMFLCTACRELFKSVGLSRTSQGIIRNGKILGISERAYKLSF